MLGRVLAAAHVELEEQLVVSLKCDVEIVHIDQQPNLFVNGAQHFVSIQMRADDLADFRQQLVLTRGTPALLHGYVALERDPNLHRDTQQKADMRWTQRARVALRQKNYAELPLPRLQAHGCQA